ncbi:hypothetical protein [Nocardia abscessus]|uniref:hypothetical protein n=1 Tax=Nocardia abscessus TaxID=120957 RepID=UPI0024554247|nr:hypothetical protein [Nocardia abscessus]
MCGGYVDLVDLVLVDHDEAHHYAVHGVADALGRAGVERVAWTDGQQSVGDIAQVRVAPARIPDLGDRRGVLGLGAAQYRGNVRHPPDCGSG